MSTHENDMHEDEQPQETVDGAGLRLSAGAIVSGAGTGALLAFMLQNRDDVEVSFLVWDFTLSVWLLTLISALLGAVVWFSLGVLRRHRRRKERRHARQAGRD